MLLFSAWAYKRDISTCQDYVLSEPERIEKLQQSYREIYGNCSNWRDLGMNSIENFNFSG